MHTNRGGEESVVHPRQTESQAEITKERRRSRRRNTRKEEEDVSCDSIAIRGSALSPKRSSTGSAEIRNVVAIDPAADPSIEDRTGANRLPDRSVPPGLFYDRAACGFAGQFSIRVVPRGISLSFANRAVRDIIVIRKDSSRYLLCIDRPVNANEREI